MTPPPPADTPVSPDQPQMLAMVLRWLERGDQSTQRLRERLKQKGGDEKCIELVIKELQAQGWIDDVRCADALAKRWCRQAPMATDALAHRLKESGIPPDIAHDTAQTHNNAIEPIELALQLGRERLRRMETLPRTTAARRIQGILARRGFEEEVVLDTLRRLDLVEM